MIRPKARPVRSSALPCASRRLAQESTFKVDVQLVRLIATVKDTAGSPVGGLNKEDFTVFDNGVKQEIACLSGTRLSRCPSPCCSIPAARPARR